jgi:uncharacterized protein YhaN
MSYSLEIEGLVAHKHKLEAEIERLQLRMSEIIDNSTRAIEDGVRAQADLRAEIERLRKGWKREADKDCKWALAEIERLEAEVERLHATTIDEIKRRLSDRLNDHLCEMKPDYDDSIVGFNEAWDVMRKLFDEIEARRTPERK